jgi:hypothetical protein
VYAVACQFGDKKYEKSVKKVSKKKRNFPLNEKSSLIRSFSHLLNYLTT